MYCRQRIVFFQPYFLAWLVLLCPRACLFTLGISRAFTLFSVQLCFCFVLFSLSCFTAASSMLPQQALHLSRRVETEAGGHWTYRCSRIEHNDSAHTYVCYMRGSFLLVGLVWYVLYSSQYILYDIIYPLELLLWHVMHTETDLTCNGWRVQRWVYYPVPSTTCRSRPAFRPKPRGSRGAEQALQGLLLCWVGSWQDGESYGNQLAASELFPGRHSFLLLYYMCRYIGVGVL